MNPNPKPTLTLTVTCQVLSLGYGMLSTVHALETPGGDDDRQWYVRVRVRVGLGFH